MPVVTLERWYLRRLFPLLGTLVLAGIGMATTVWWGPAFSGHSTWALPDDLWGTLIAAQRLAGGHLAGLYSQPTGLVSFPGAAVILLPAVSLMNLAGVRVQSPSALNAHPSSWLVAGPYEIVISCSVLFATDALAEHLGLSRPKRFVLATAEAIALWSVSVRWGHPEDAVAVALLLFGILAIGRGSIVRAAWLIGAGVAVQPLVLLALPVVLVALPPRRLIGFCTGVVAPAGVFLGAAGVANFHAVVHVITSQPNYPAIDHPTPWTSLSPHLSGGAVAAGPWRLVAIAVACAVAVAVRGRWGEQRAGGAFTAESLIELLWWSAATLALRCVFESVMVAYYLWPVLALGLVPAACRRWLRFTDAAVTASALTFVSQASWRGAFGWWGMVVAGLGVTLFFARPASLEAVPPFVVPAGDRAQGSQETWLTRRT